MRAQAWHDLFDTTVFEIEHTGARASESAEGGMACWRSASAGAGVVNPLLRSNQQLCRRTSHMPTRSPHFAAAAAAAAAADVARFKEELLRFAQELLA